MHVNCPLFCEKNKICVIYMHAHIVYVSLFASLINKFEKLIYNEPKKIFGNDILLVAKFCYEYI
jgi:hypothetical protein